MRVKKLLDQKGHDVYSVAPDTTVYDALKLMAEKEIGALVVLEEGKMVGLISNEIEVFPLEHAWQEKKEIDLRLYQLSQIMAI